MRRVSAGGQQDRLRALTVKTAGSMKLGSEQVKCETYGHKQQPGMKSSVIVQNITKKDGVYARSVPRCKRPPSKRLRRLTRWRSPKKTNPKDFSRIRITAGRKGLVCSVERRRNFGKEQPVIGSHSACVFP